MADWLPHEDWVWAQSHLPIACVDLVPVHVEQDQLTGVGLILRDAPEGAAWCLVGGRINLNESIADAALRHLAETLGRDVRIDSVDWGRPDFVGQYFLERRESYPFDPRQHSVALTFAAVMRGTPYPQGEARDFRWFSLEARPVTMGFDQQVVVDQVLARLGPGSSRTRWSG